MVSTGKREYVGIRIALTATLTTFFDFNTFNYLEIPSFVKTFSPSFP